MIEIWYSFPDDVSSILFVFDALQTALVSESNQIHILDDALPTVLLCVCVMGYERLRSA